jgi:hypothetical protein
MALSELEKKALLMHLNPDEMLAYGSADPLLKGTVVRLAVAKEALEELLGLINFLCATPEIKYPCGLDAQRKIAQGAMYRAYKALGFSDEELGVNFPEQVKS